MKNRNRMANQPVGAVWIASILAIALTSGCINLEAPDKPIVIELNINISQEVLVRINEDSEALIEENEDIF